MENNGDATKSEAYTRRLQSKGSARWKELLDVQRPYRWNLQRLDLGFTLDVGCGIGRNLKNLNGHGVGVDHNPTSIAHARSRGFQAFTVEEFLSSSFAKPHTFDSLLVAHVLEHLDLPAGQKLLETYLPFIRRTGKVVLITPQQAGQASDPTHVTYLDFAALDSLGAAVGLTKSTAYSFPLPAALGRIFPYNEHVWLGSFLASASPDRQETRA